MERRSACFLDLDCRKSVGQAVVRTAFIEDSKIDHIKCVSSQIKQLPDIADVTAQAMQLKLGSPSTGAWRLLDGPFRFR
jgi:hypothetical protein